MIHKIITSIVALAFFALLVCAATGCATRYMLAGEPAVGTHTVVDTTQAYESASKGDDPPHDFYKRGENHSSTRNIVVRERDDGKRVYMTLRKIVEQRVDKLLRDGKEDEELRKRHEKIYRAMFSRAFLSGEDPYEKLQPNNLPAYLAKKLTDFPDRPLAIGGTWEADVKDETYSGHAEARLVDVKDIDGRRVAVIEGVYSSVWNYTDPKGEKYVIKSECDDFLCEFDIDAHVALKTTYTDLFDVKADDGTMTMTTKNTMVLTSREVLDNEKWQPGISQFADDLRAMWGVDPDNPLKQSESYLRIVDFAKRNPDTLCGEFAQYFVDNYKTYLGKSLLGMISFDKLGDWFNSPPLKDKDLKGKVVIVEWWATKCGPCVEVSRRLADMHRKYADDGLVVIGVTNEKGITADELRKHLTDSKIAYPILWDKERVLADKLNFNYVPHVLVLRPDGVIVWDDSGDIQGDAFENLIKRLLKAE